MTADGRSTRRVLEPRSGRHSDQPCACQARKEMALFAKAVSVAELRPIAAGRSLLNFVFFVFFFYVLEEKASYAIEISRRWG